MRISGENLWEGTFLQANLYESTAVVKVKCLLKDE